MPNLSHRDVTLQPNAWLKEMAHLNPAPWNLSRSVRAAVAIALPMIVGYWTDTLMLTMWISMGAMFPSIGERDAPYSFTIRKILISAPIGACGFLLGYAGLWIPDWTGVVLLMGTLGFLSAIASSYSATLSIACLQFMVMAAVALGNPEIATFWKSSALLLCGAAFYLLLVLVEKWLKPHQLRKDAILSVLEALIGICDKKITGTDLEAARLQFNIKYEALYTLMLQTRYQALGHNPVLDQTANIVHNLDNLFVMLMAQSDLTAIRQLKTQLQAMTSAFSNNDPYHEIAPRDFAFLDAVNDLAQSLWSRSALPPASPGSQAPVRTRPHWRVLIQRLTPGQSTLRTACALALCTMIGYAIHWVDHVSHWYWVPMTVAIVMKPELGSIFARAVQRTVGTAAGVMIGGAILSFVPVGPTFILIIAAITFALPWLAPRNYALTAFAITPLVLVLIDFLSPAKNGMEYATLRMVDTLMGSLIVLLFGYLLWPRRRSRELQAAMNQARQGLAHYLQLVLEHRTQPDAPAVSDARRTAYSQLVDMRTALQKSLSEPPPAGYEAAAWFPLVACTARLCDAITVYSVTASAQPDPEEWAWLQKMPQCIAGLTDLPYEPATQLQGQSPESLLITTIRKETYVRQRLYERVSETAHHHTPEEMASTPTQNP